MTASMVSMDDKVTCRRCRRPLRSARAVAAGIGERCALLALLEAVGGPVWAVEGPSAAQSVVALVTAFFEHADDQVGPLLAEADLRDVAGLLAAVTALYLQDQPVSEVLPREGGKFLPSVKQLGHWLKAREGRHFGEYRLRRRYDKHAKVNLWWVEHNPAANPQT